MASDSKNSDEVKQHLLNIEARLDRLLVTGSDAFSRCTGEEIDVRALFMTLWKGKWIIAASTFVFGTCAVIFSLALPNIYRSQALLVPAEYSGGAGFSGVAGQFGGLAALAGVSLGGSETSKAELAVQVLKSRHFVNSFIQERDLHVPLMAVKKWDSKTNTLVLDHNIYDEQAGGWVRSEGKMAPTPQETYTVFMENNLSIGKDKETGLYTLAVTHPSPYVAQQWVNWLIIDINEVMRARTISETTQNLEYLNIQLQKTAVANMQTTLYRLIEEQTKSLMLAEVQEEFVFKVIDPPVVPESKDRPKRVFIGAIGALLGAALGGGFVLIVLRSRKEDAYIAP